MRGTYGTRRAGRPIRFRTNVAAETMGTRLSNVIVSASPVGNVNVSGAAVHENITYLSSGAVPAVDDRRACVRGTDRRMRFLYKIRVRLNAPFGGNKRPNPREIRSTDDYRAANAHDAQFERPSTSSAQRNESRVKNTLDVQRTIARFEKPKVW